MPTYDEAYTEVYETHCRKIDPDIEGYGLSDLVGNLLTAIETKVEEIDPSAAEVLARVMGR